MAIGGTQHMRMRMRGDTMTRDAPRGGEGRCTRSLQGIDARIALALLAHPRLRHIME